MADTLDVLTLAEAKAELDIDPLDTTKETQLAAVVTAISRRMDQRYGCVVQRVVGNELHSFPTNLAAGARTRIELDFCPVYSVSQVTNWLGTTSTLLTEQTPGLSPSNGWFGEQYKPIASLYSGVIVRKTGLYPYPFGDLVSVTYTAGMYTSTTSVDEQFKLGAKLMLRNQWRAYQQGVGSVNEFDVPQQNFPTFSIPRAVDDLLSVHIKPEVGFG